MNALEGLKNVIAPKQARIKEISRMLDERNPTGKGPKFVGFDRNKLKQERGQLVNELEEFQAQV